MVSKLQELRLTTAPNGKFLKVMLQGPGGPHFRIIGAVRANAVPRRIVKILETRQTIRLTLSRNSLENLATWHLDDRGHGIQWHSGGSDAGLMVRFHRSLAATQHRRQSNFSGS